MGREPIRFIVENKNPAEEHEAKEHSSDHVNDCQSDVAGGGIQRTIVLWIESQKHFIENEVKYK